MTPLEALMRSWLESDDPALRRHAGHRLALPFASAVETGGVQPEPEPEPARRAPCAYLGGPVVAGGRRVLRGCEGCGGNVRLKVFGCGHPGHAGEPTTTHRECEGCRDYAVEAGPVEVAGDPIMNFWRGGS